MTEPLIKTPTTHTSMNDASKKESPLLLDIENLSVLKHLVFVKYLNR